MSIAEILPHMNRYVRIKKDVCKKLSFSPKSFSTHRFDIFANIRFEDMKNVEEIVFDCNQCRTIGKFNDEKTAIIFPDIPDFALGAAWCYFEIKPQNPQEPVEYTFIRDEIIISCAVYLCGFYLKFNEKYTIFEGFMGERTMRNDAMPDLNILREKSEIESEYVKFLEKIQNNEKFIRLEARC